MFFILYNKGILEIREINNINTRYKNIINRHFSNQGLKRKSLFGSKWDVLLLKPPAWHEPKEKIDIRNSIFMTLFWENEIVCTKDNVVIHKKIDEWFQWLIW